MKIMIIGGLGFIGSHLASKLAKNQHSVIIISKTRKKQKNLDVLSNKIKLEVFDILNEKKLVNSLISNKPDVIIHLAGITSHSKSFEKPILDINSNAKSTLLILDNIRKLNLCCRFVLGSTFIVVGKPEKLPVTELSPCNPTTLYGANRLASEHYCKIYHDVYDIDTVIFRITNSFGPKEQVVSNKNAVNYLIYKAHLGHDITIFNNGKFFRDLIYVDDVISGIFTIMRKGKSGNLYWISSGTKTWFRDFGNILEELTCAKVKYIKSSTYTKKTDVGNFVVSNKKLSKLGWSPKFSLKLGIKKTLKYFESTN